MPSPSDKNALEHPYANASSNNMMLMAGRVATKVKGGQCLPTTLQTIFQNYGVGS